jgi:hypothetical protein
MIWKLSVDGVCAAAALPKSCRLSVTIRSRRRWRADARSGGVTCSALVGFRSAMSSALLDLTLRRRDGFDGWDKGLLPALLHTTRASDFSQRRPSLLVSPDPCQLVIAGGSCEWGGRVGRRGRAAASWIFITHRTTPQVSANTAVATRHSRIMGRLPQKRRRC